MMQRARSSTAAMAVEPEAEGHDQHPASIVAAMLGALVRLTEAPWCRVFHHFTEK